MRAVRIGTVVGLTTTASYFAGEQSIPGRSNPASCLSERLVSIVRAGRRKRSHLQPGG